MNTQAFIVLFFNLAMLMCADAFWDFGTSAAAGLGTIGTFGSLNTVALNGALTIPLATATVGTLATPLAVLGVLKLGAAAAIALGYFALSNNNDDSYSESGYGYGGDFHRRGKRNADSPSEEGIFALISTMDTHGCGKQLVCELEAKSEAELENDERLMLQLFSKNKKNTVNPASAKSEYVLAAQLGMASKNEVICRHRYAACPYTSTEMMAALRNSHL